MRGLGTPEDLSKFIENMDKKLTSTNPKNHIR
jgi:hypothetical protein